MEAHSDPGVLIMTMIMGFIAGAAMAMSLVTAAKRRWQFAW